MVYVVRQLVRPPPQLPAVPHHRVAELHEFQEQRDELEPREDEEPPFPKMVRDWVVRQELPPQVEWLDLRDDGLGPCVCRQVHLPVMRVVPVRPLVAVAVALRPDRVLLLPPVLELLPLLFKEPRHHPFEPV